MKQQNETFARCALQGVPLIIGIGILAALAIRFGFGLPLAKLARPITILVGIQVGFYLGMYAIRKRYKPIGDFRPAFIVAGLYLYFIVLAGMYYAGRLGIVNARTFEDNYVEFSVVTAVVICIGVAFFSFVRLKQTQ